MKLSIALAKSFEDIDAPNFNGSYPDDFETNNPSNVKEEQTHFFAALNRDNPPFTLRRSGTMLYACTGEKYFAWYDVKSGLGYRRMTTNEFLDYHPPNTRDMDFLTFSGRVRALVKRSQFMVVDRSASPIIYFITRDTKDVLAWYDEEDEIGYLKSN